VSNHKIVIKRTLSIAASLALAAGVGLAARVPAAQAMAPTQRTEAGVVNHTAKSINRYWAIRFAKYRLTYSAPRGIYFYHPGEWNTACGSTADQHNNSFYCPRDRNIYLEVRWNQRQINVYGDGAAAFIFAHEWGHHIQKLDGWWDYENGDNAQLELNADCEAGMYFRYGVGKGILSSHDYREARTWKYNNGGGDLSHGTGLQRLQWFDYGYQTGNLGACNAIFK
jgi:uncharacterized protein